MGVAEDLAALGILEKILPEYRQGGNMGGFASDGGTVGVTGLKYKLNVYELLKDKLLQIYKYRFEKNQNITPANWKTNAEDLIAEAKKNYSLTDNHPKDKELINELAWILWEASEKIGEFSGKSEEKAKETISTTAREMAIKIERIYTNKPKSGWSPLIPYAGPPGFE